MNPQLHSPPTKASPVFYKKWQRARAALSTCAAFFLLTLLVLACLSIERESSFQETSKGPSTAKTKHMSEELGCWWNKIYILWHRSWPSFILWGFSGIKSKISNSPFLKIWSNFNRLSKCIHNPNLDMCFLFTQPI